MASNNVAVPFGGFHAAKGLQWANGSNQDVPHQALSWFLSAAQRPVQHSGKASSLVADAWQGGPGGGALTARQTALEPNRQWAGASREARGILEAFVNTCRRWRMERSDQVVLLGYPSGDPIGEAILAGRVMAFSRDVDDRAAYVVAISIGLGIMFEEDPEAENRWLRHPRDVFGDDSPLDFMLRGNMGNLIAVNELVERERGF